MGVLMQAFYWDCPREEQQEFTWWKHLKGKAKELGKAGFTALWLPPAGKGANIGGMSMGYDVYDYYDLGTHDQKGSVKTWFGSEEELRDLIKAAHTAKLTVYADLVLNHNNGADAAELNPIINQMRWTRFTPQSKLFTRDWTCFNPSPYPNPNPGTFGDMPDLCHTNPRVMTGILNHAKWLIQEIGFDGFRYDFVKGFGGWMIRAIHDRSYARDGKPVSLYGVGECWDNDATIDAWLDSVNNWTDNRVGAFDFPLRYRLKDLCDTPGYSLRSLVAGGALYNERPLEAVTFVDNHDFRDRDEVTNDKMLAYAFILTHEGYPCVYWKDYFTYGLAQPGEPSGIERLVAVHESHAGGQTNILWLDDGFYVMERSGAGKQPGLLMVLNNAAGLRQEWVRSCFGNKTLRPLAWRAAEAIFDPQPVTVDSDGWCCISLLPRGYVVYGE